MKIVLIGEAADHRDELAAGLDGISGQDRVPEIIALPREAAFSDGHDERIKPDDVVVSLKFTRSGSAPPFRLLQVPGAGLDGIDFTCLDPGTLVCNVYEHEIPIAEYVLGCLLEWEIGIARMRAAFSAENWAQAYRGRAPHGEVHGRTLGLLGYGRIGKAIASRADAFGMHVMAVDAVAAADEHVERLLSPDKLDEMLRAADYVVICCPLTPQTEGIIGARELRLMKASAMLVNVSRAPIADETALYEALRTRGIAGAFLDVWYRYPAGTDDNVPPANTPLLDLPNVFGTPHSSAWTVDLPRRRYAFIARNISRLMQADPLQNVVRG
jgi:phosphoglycerate dehydrogenase-like enzyme